MELIFFPSQIIEAKIKCPVEINTTQRGFFHFYLDKQQRESREIVIANIRYPR